MTIQMADIVKITAISDTHGRTDSMLHEALSIAAYTRLSEREKARGCELFGGDDAALYAFINGDLFLDTLDDKYALTDDSRELIRISNAYFPPHTKASG
jgi:hypothetical protein